MGTGAAATLCAALVPNRHRHLAAYLKLDLPTMPLTAAPRAVNRTNRVLVDIRAIESYVPHSAGRAMLETSNAVSLVQHNPRA